MTGDNASLKRGIKAPSTEYNGSNTNKTGPWGFTFLPTVHKQRLTHVAITLHLNINELHSGDRCVLLRRKHCRFQGQCGESSDAIPATKLCSKIGGPVGRESYSVYFSPDFGMRPSNWYGMVLDSRSPIPTGHSGLGLA